MELSSDWARGDTELVLHQEAQRLVDVEGLGSVPFGGERLHQQPVAALAVGRELDERPTRSLRGVELGTAEPETTRGDALVRTQPHVIEL